MIHRAISTLGCAELSLDAVFALGARHGIRQFELRALAGSLDLPGYLGREFGSPTAFAARVKRASVRIVSLDTSCKLIGCGAAERADLLEFARWADAANVRWLRVFDGGQACDELSIGEAADTLAWWRAERRNRGIGADVMIETHDVLLDAARIERFIAAVPGEVPAILWDAHHTWRRGGEDPVTTWRAIGKHVVHVHVKDSARTGTASGWSYVLPGTGEFPMSPLRTELLLSFRGAVSLEWERLWHPELPSLDDALLTASRNDWW